MFGNALPDQFPALSAANKEDAFGEAPLEYIKPTLRDHAILWLRLIVDLLYK